MSRPLIALVALALVATACGSSATSAPAAAPTPTTAASAPGTAAPTVPPAAATPSPAPATPAPELATPIPGEMSLSPVVTPSPAPTSTPGPAAVVFLNARVVYGFVLDTDWKAKKAKGRARYELSVSNMSDEPRYPSCTITHTAGEPNRSVDLTWAGASPVAPGDTAAFTAEFTGVPLDSDPEGVYGFDHDVSCDGLLLPAAGARKDAPATLAAEITRSSGSRPVGSTATIRFTFRVRNPTTSAVRASCRIQVAGSAHSQPPLRPRERMKAYVVNDKRKIAAGKSVSISVVKTGVPVKRSGSYYHWYWTVRCWAR